MSNVHKRTILNNKTFKRLFTRRERENLHCLMMYGGQNHGQPEHWDYNPVEDIIMVHTDEGMRVECRKIDAAEGPWIVPPLREEELIRRRELVLV